ncbi:MAG TPA: group 1 truncated hemoglobin [Nitrospira sp.]|nr:group 1 truncated hemoglobin [Nitrospira sp.]
MKSAIALCAVTTALLAGLAGWTSMERSSHAMTREQTLYDRLGGKAAISAVVEDLVARVAADSRINVRFANADVPRLKTMLADQICQATGGPCTYTGRDMKRAHSGMRITGDEFDALVGDLVATLNTFKVGEREKNELLGALAPMTQDIVTSRVAARPSSTTQVPPINNTEQRGARRRRTARPG